MQLDVHLLELPHRGTHLLFHRLGAAIGASRILFRLRILGLEHDHPLGREPALTARCVARDGERLLERGEMLDVLAVHALRDVLECAHCLVAGLALRVARVDEREERDVRCEALHHACAEEAARLVDGDDGRELPVHAKSTEGEEPFLFEGGIEAEETCVFVGLVAEVDELAAGKDLRADARGEVIDSGVGARANDLGAAGAHALAQHLVAGIVAEKRELGTTVHLGEGFAKRNDGRVEVRRCRERMSERRESARWHGEGRAVWKRGPPNVNVEA